MWIMSLMGHDDFFFLVLWGSLNGWNTIRGESLCYNGQWSLHQVQSQDNQLSYYHCRKTALGWIMGLFLADRYLSMDHVVTIVKLICKFCRNINSSCNIFLKCNIVLQKIIAWGKGGAELSEKDDLHRLDPRFFFLKTSCYLEHLDGHLPMTWWSV